MRNKIERFIRSLDPIDTITIIFVVIAISTILLLNIITER